MLFRNRISHVVPELFKLGSMPGEINGAFNVILFAHQVNVIYTTKNPPFKFSTSRMPRFTSQVLLISSFWTGLPPTVATTSP